MSDVIVAAVLLVAAGGVRADSADTLNFVLSETIVSDDNLFRLPTGVDPVGLGGNGQRSDRFTADALGFSLDKSYSLQRFHLDASYVNYRYDTYHFLDFGARNGAARWTWALTPRLTGNLSFDQQQSLNSFADYTNLSVRNINTVTNRNADLDFWFYGGWHITAGGFRTRNTNTVAFLQGGDLDRRGGQGGLRYVAANGDYIAYQDRYSRGIYPDTSVIAPSIYSPAFHQIDHEMSWRWTPGGHMQLQGRITQFERRHDDFPVRDFEGTAGKVDYAWTPTGKTQVLISAARSYGAFLASNASYYVTDARSIAPSWQMTAKMLLKLKFEHLARDYPGNPGLAAGSRTDTQRRRQVSLDWTPLKALVLTGAVQRELRRSTATGFDYDTTTTSLSAQLSF